MTQAIAHTLLVHTRISHSIRVEAQLTQHVIVAPFFLKSRYLCPTALSNAWRFGTKTSLPLRVKIVGKHSETRSEACPKSSCGTDQDNLARSNDHRIIWLQLARTHVTFFVSLPKSLRAFCALTFLCLVSPSLHNVQLCLCVIETCFWAQEREPRKRNVLALTSRSKQT